MLCSCFSPLLWVSKKISTSQNIRAYHILNNWKKCLYADKTNWYQGRLLVELLNRTLIYRDTTNAAPDFMIIFILVIVILDTMSASWIQTYLTQIYLQ